MCTPTPTPTPRERRTVSFCLLHLASSISSTLVSSSLPASAPQLSPFSTLRSSRFSLHSLFNLPRPRPPLFLPPPPPFFTSTPSSSRPARSHPLAWPPWPPRSASMPKNRQALARLVRRRSSMLRTKASLRRLRPTPWHSVVVLVV